MKNKILNKGIVIIILILITKTTVYSQLTDNYSQFQNTPTLVNPANAALYEDVVIGLHYRKQSLSGDMGFSTGALEFAYPIFLKDEKSSNHAYRGNLNLTVLQEKAGMNGMLQTSKVIAGAVYNLDLSSNNFLSMGVQSAYIHQNVDLSLITTDNQYNNGVYDPSLPHGENFNSGSKGSMLFNAGLTWFGKNENHETQFWLGVAANNLSKTSVDFLSTKEKENMNFIANGGVVVAKNDRITLSPIFQLRYSNEIDQLSSGALVKYSLNVASPGQALTLGALYNIQKAVALSLTYSSMAYSIVFAYDMPFGGEYEGEQVNNAVEAHLFWRINRNTGSR